MRKPTAASSAVEMKKISELPSILSVLQIKCYFVENRPSRRTVSVAAPEHVVMGCLSLRNGSVRVARIIRAW